MGLCTCQKYDGPQTDRPPEEPEGGMHEVPECRTVTSGVEGDRNGRFPYMILLHERGVCFRGGGEGRLSQKNLGLFPEDGPDFVNTLILWSSRELIWLRDPCVPGLARLSCQRGLFKEIILPSPI